MEISRTSASGIVLFRIVNSKPLRNKGGNQMDIIFYVISIVVALHIGYKAGTIADEQPEVDK